MTTTSQLEQSPIVAGQSLRRRLATSQETLPRLLRWAYKAILKISVPAPKIIGCGSLY
jgi:hypothetical protein